MKKNTIILITIALILLALIGAGVWTLVNRPNNQQPKGAQDTTANQQNKTFSMDEVATHSSKTDCWTVISGQVYDLTDFVNRHPGGNEVVRACGIDATTLFTSRTTEDGQPVGSGTPHSQVAQEQLAELKIGTIKKN
ncbi:MAG TPA: cytochrome b5-like heme/steroid binding domain-containing protein [Candidatus Saccharibacteria bacterium]|nr:cytochrome b5-like heme/steroid binding domain-containing protein [Candidatus Saccharibacteria bacterium]